MSRSSANAALGGSNSKTNNSSNSNSSNNSSGVDLNVFVTDVLGNRRAVHVRFKRSSDVSVHGLKAQVGCAPQQLLFLSSLKPLKGNQKNTTDSTKDHEKQNQERAEEVLKCCEMETLLKTDADIDLVKPRSELRIAASKRATQLVKQQTTLSRAQSASQGISAAAAIVGSEKESKLKSSMHIGLPGSAVDDSLSNSFPTAANTSSSVGKRNSHGADSMSKDGRPNGRRSGTGSGRSSLRSAPTPSAPPFRVTSFAPVNSGGKVFTAFIVEYRDPRKSVREGEEIPTSLLLKRYSQFQELHKDVGSEFGKHVLPKLPSKAKRFAKTTTDSIVRRMRKLEGYLNELALTIPKVTRSGPFLAFVDAKDIAPSNTAMKSEIRQKRRESFYRHDTRAKSRRSGRDDEKRRADSAKRLSGEAKKSDVDRADSEQQNRRNERVSSLRAAAEENKRASIQLQNRTTALAHDEAKLKAVKQKRRESQLLAEEAKSSSGSAKAGAFSSPEALQAALAEEARKEEEREAAQEAEAEQSDVASSKIVEPGAVDKKTMMTIDQEDTAGFTPAEADRTDLTSSSSDAPSITVDAHAPAAEPATKPAQIADQTAEETAQDVVASTFNVEESKSAIVGVVASTPKPRPVRPPRTGNVGMSRIPVPQKPAPPKPVGKTPIRPQKAFNKPSAAVGSSPGGKSPVKQRAESALDDLLSDLSTGVETESDSPPADLSVSNSGSKADSQQAMDEILAMLEGPEPDEPANLRAATVAMDEIMSLLDGPEELVEAQQKQVEAERLRLAEERERIREEAQMLEQIILEEQEEEQIMAEMIQMRQQAIAQERERFENYRSEAWVRGVLEAERRWRANKEQNRPNRLKTRFASPVPPPGNVEDQDTRGRIIQFIGVAEYGLAPGDADDDEFRGESSRLACVMCGQSSAPLTNCNGGCGRAVHPFCRCDQDADGELPPAWMCFDCAETFGGDDEDDPDACVMCGTSEGGGMGDMVACANNLCSRRVHALCIGLEEDNNGVLPEWFCFDCET